LPFSNTPPIFFLGYPNGKKMIIMLNDCFWLNTIMTFLLKEIGITLERGTYKILNEELFRYDVPDYGDLPVR
jgi:hypothetical protein